MDPSFWSIIQFHPNPFLGIILPRLFPEIPDIMVKHKAHTFDQDIQRLLQNKNA